ncbi:putative integral membrane protein [Janibacter sp. HTCC2649]|uniref:anthrone oxygenase family protein n=1 Tax=Janibacter sp. HTCC2649 TaxID=313589 RepID=UPI000066EBB0|nr:anthrone oxygenase family protein [Janibacter sp. HTCC2649]EAP98526.1 putative integral membrane protein [Janibacter sp. HTCC2649]
MSPQVWILAATALAAAVFGGAMFSFSTFVMPALRELAPRDGILAMQSINRWAPKSLLLLPMGVLALGGVVVIGMGLLEGGDDRALKIVGALLAIASLVITGAANVPINNKVDALTAGSEAEGEWAAYAAVWCRWNHLRTVTSLASAVLLAVAAART